MPTCLHFPSKNPPKSLQESISKGIKISIDVQTRFFSILAPSWTPEPPKMPPRRPPSWPSKTDTPSSVSVLAAKSPPRPPRTPLGPLQDRFLGRFWRQLGCVLPPKMHQKQPQEPSKIRCHFNANLSPFLIERSTNIFSKIDANLMPTCPHFSSFWPEPKMTTNPESLQKWDPISTTKKKNN